MDDDDDVTKTRKGSNVGQISGRTALKALGLKVFLVTNKSIWYF